MRTLLHTILQALVDAEATEHIGAGMHEQNDARTTQRNGTRTKVVSTSSGNLSVKIGKTRTGSFFPFLSSHGESPVRPTFECGDPGVFRFDARIHTTSWPTLLSTWSASSSWSWDRELGRRLRAAGANGRSSVRAQPVTQMTVAAMNAVAPAARPIQPAAPSDPTRRYDS